MKVFNWWALTSSAKPRQVLRKWLFQQRNKTRGPQSRPDEQDMKTTHRVVVLDRVWPCWQNYGLHVRMLLHYIALHCSVKFWSALYCTQLQCTVMHINALNCTTQYCTVLHFTALYYTVLSLTVLHFFVINCTSNFVQNKYLKVLFLKLSEQL